MNKHQSRQSQQVNRERRAFIEEISHEQFILKCKRKQYEPGVTWLWALSAAYGPVGSASRIEKAELPKESAA